MKMHAPLQRDQPFSLFQISNEAYPNWVKSLILGSRKAVIDFISIPI